MLFPPSPLPASSHFQLRALLEPDVVCPVVNLSSVGRGIAQSSLECVQNLLQLEHPLAKSFTGLASAAWRNTPDHFESNSYQLCLTVAPSCFGRHREQPTPIHPLHATQDFVDLNQFTPTVVSFSRLMSLSLLSQKLSNYTCSLLACSQGITEFSKKVSLSRLTAHPHCRTSFVGWTLSIPSINIRTKLVICQWSQIFNHQCVHTLARHEEIHSPALAVSVPATYNTGSLM